MFSINGEQCVGVTGILGKCNACLKLDFEMHKSPPAPLLHPT